MSWYPDLPHVQAGGDGGPRSQTQMIVIHATDNTASDQAEASYAQTRPDHTSAHFYSDEDSVTQALDTSHIAYGCFPTGNSRSVQFEISGLSNQLTDASLRRVAPIVARACQEYGIPIRKVTPTELVNGVKGICGHLDVTRAWGEGDHTDPGSYFPWDTFISYVQAASANPLAAAADGEDDEEMSTGMLERGFCANGQDITDWSKVSGVGLGPVNGGEFGNKRCVLGLSTDGAPAEGVQVRVAIKSEGLGWGVKLYTLHSADNRLAIFLPDKATKISVARSKRPTDADDSTAATCPVWWDLEFEKR
jgi:N-acetyl-anhydromuramyl-L-alanine amidase AmpD